MVGILPFLIRLIQARSGMNCKKFFIRKSPSVLKFLFSFSTLVYCCFHKIQKYKHFVIQWKPLNGITLGQSITDPINQIKFLDKVCSRAGMANLFYLRAKIQTKKLGGPDTLVHDRPEREKDVASKSRTDHQNYYNYYFFFFNIFFWCTPSGYLYFQFCQQIAPGLKIISLIFFRSLKLLVRTSKDKKEF